MCLDRGWNIRHRNQKAYLHSEISLSKVKQSIKKEGNLIEKKENITELSCNIGTPIW